MFTAQRQIAIFVAYFLVYVVWGSTYYFIGVALQGLPPSCSAHYASLRLGSSSFLYAISERKKYSGKN